jgi:hypothetical protein
MTGGFVYTKTNPNRYCLHAADKLVYEVGKGTPITSTNIPKLWVTEEALDHSGYRNSYFANNFDGTWDIKADLDWVKPPGLSLRMSIANHLKDAI